MKAITLVSQGLLAALFISLLTAASTTCSANGILDFTFAGLYSDSGSGELLWDTTTELSAPGSIFMVPGEAGAIDISGQRFAPQNSFDPPTSGAFHLLLPDGATFFMSSCGHCGLNPPQLWELWPPNGPAFAIGGAGYWTPVPDALSTLVMLSISLTALGVFAKWLKAPLPV